ncbi:hypothetical protein M408DRAFT_164045 [Serendipita vermifera MAFF 305830]|uniref:Uncharacterized protein n=1 Tax=Serendipita vermifera MAFF 305830 TaxID=933852 RepID=A0A0C2XF32_SERVB|nr:hypothetical protein M408DRAFT_164045 [Serendipita vermifera MAFF 305830]
MEASFTLTLSRQPLRLPAIPPGRYNLIAKMLPKPLDVAIVKYTGPYRDQIIDILLQLCGYDSHSVVLALIDGTHDPETVFASLVGPWGSLCDMTPTTTRDGVDVIRCRLSGCSEAFRGRRLHQDYGRHFPLF